MAEFFNRLEDTRIDWRRVGLVLLVVLVGLSPFFKVILEPRSLADIGMDPEPLLLDAPEPPAWALAHVVLNLGIFSLALGLLLYAVLTRKSAAETRANYWLWSGFLCFVLMQALGYQFSETPSFNFRMLAFPVVFLSFLAMRSDDLPSFVRLGREIAFFYIAGSLVSAVLFPQRSFEYPFPSIIPIRLSGVSSHANALAPLVGLFMAFDFAAAHLGIPVHPKRRVIDWIFSLLVLILCQSKTIALGILGAGLITWLVRGCAPRAVVGSLILVVIACLAVIGLDLIDIKLESDNQAVEQAITLTGRTDLWFFVIDLWMRNPLFGYGPLLLQDETRLEFLHLFNWLPAQAHNQWLQILGESGIVGLIGQTIYNVALVISAGRAIWVCGAGPLLLVILMLIRSLTEQTLDSFMFGEAFTYHFFLFGVLIAAGGLRPVSLRSAAPAVAPRHLLG